MTWPSLLHKYTLPMGTLVHSCKHCLESRTFLRVSKRLFSSESIDCLGSEVDENRDLLPHKRKRKLIRSKGQSGFVDWRDLIVRGGDGGDGSSHFRDTLSQNGGPDGGNGGDGGDIIVVVDHNQRQLAHLNKMNRAKDGGDGASCFRQGKRGSDIELRVPVGCQVIDSESRNILYDLMVDEQRICLAKGGKGGNGNCHFKSPTHQSPEEFGIGGVGEEKKLEIEMKSIAHVGLVGFPNAGKSTLLRSLSRAKPRIASYPFTTLKPHIGIVEFPDTAQFAIADIPGLVKDAHIDKGLGHSFLRHIERCHTLLYVVDASSGHVQSELEVLQEELELYKPGLSTTPSALVMNKIDLMSDLTEVRKTALERGLPVHFVSGKFRLNIEELKHDLRRMLEQSTVLF